jgi:HemK-related putative methylase
MEMLLKYTHVDKDEFRLTRVGSYELLLHSSVYPPSEDTFFIFDALDFFFNSLKFEVVAEPCTGSGLVSIKIASLGAHLLASDLNFVACYVTKENLKKNTLYYNVDVVCGNVLDFVRKESLSYVVCNPPYLPEERKDLDRFLWWNGGKSGIELIEKLIASAKNALKRGGGLLFLASNLTNLTQIKNLLVENGFSLKQTITKDLGEEQLIIFYSIKES